MTDCEGLEKPNPQIFSQDPSTKTRTNQRKYWTSCLLITSKKNYHAQLNKCCICNKDKDSYTEHIISQYFYYQETSSFKQNTQILGDSYQNTNLKHNPTDIRHQTQSTFTQDLQWHPFLKHLSIFRRLLLPRHIYSCSITPVTQVSANSLKWEYKGQWTWISDVHVYPMSHIQI